MGSIKENDYTENQEGISLIGRAFAHQARVKILELLKNEEKGFSNTELTTVLNFSKRTVMDHIYKLKDAELISFNLNKHGYEIEICDKGLRTLEALTVNRV